MAGPALSLAVVHLFGVGAVSVVSGSLRRRGQFPQASWRSGHHTNRPRAGRGGVPAWLPFAARVLRESSLASGKQTQSEPPRGPGPLRPLRGRLRGVSGRDAQPGRCPVTQAPSALSRWGRSQLPTGFCTPARSRQAPANARGDADRGRRRSWNVAALSPEWPARDAGVRATRAQNPTPVPSREPRQDQASRHLAPRG